jgi:hypothetical protein
MIEAGKPSIAHILGVHISGEPDSAGEGPPSESGDEEDMSLSELKKEEKNAAESVIEAVHAKDADALVDAFGSLYKLCEERSEREEGGESEEPEEDEEEPEEKAAE